MGIVILGTGLAGYQLAREFRKVNSTMDITLITRDDGRFYPKPQLSIARTHRKKADMLATGTAESMAAQLKATIRTQALVTAIVPQEKLIYIKDEKIIYDKLVLACGAQTIKPPILGTGAEDVHSVNHLEDYAYFEKMVQDRKNISIIGAGLIGCEFANDFTNTGLEVNLIDMAPTPLSLLIPPEVGNLLQQALTANGVHFYLNCHATKIDKINEKVVAESHKPSEKNEKNTSYRITLSNQKVIYTDFVISAIGLRPNTQLAKHANIHTHRGIVVNRYLETNQPHIYALGDCAEVEGHVLPYIAPILNGARALAKTLNGERTAVDYPAMPVLIKTPAHPIIVCPPPHGMKGDWNIEIQNNSARALFHNEANQLYGFVLTNDAVKERESLSKQIPRLITPSH